MGWGLLVWPWTWPRGTSGAPPLLHASWYVECDRGLSDTLEAHWVHRTAMTHEVPSVALAHD
eukprot:1255370-Alexandrium_andersonii.AAC.1